MTRLARILLPLILIPLLGLTPRLRAIDRALTQGYQAKSLGEHIRAANSFSKAASFTPWRSDLWEMAGLEALAGGDPALAATFLERAEELRPLTPEGQLALGEAVFQSGDVSRAIQVWESALSAGKLETQFHIRLVEVYHQHGDYSLEITHRRALLELDPGNPLLAFQLGLILAATTPEASLAYLSQARDLDPSLSDKVEAIQREVSSARRGDDPAYFLLAAGRGLARIGEWELAVIAFNRSVESRPDYAEAWAYLGEARQHLDQDGVPELDKALAIDPHSVSANTFLALYWQRQGHYDRSLSYLSAALEGQPDNPTLLAELGNTHALAGDLVAAQTSYERAIEVAPRDPRYWRRLAEFTLKYEFRVQETGLPAARQALDLDPEDPASLDVIAQVSLLLGDALSAEDYLEQALQSDPSHAPAHLHLAVLYLESGETYLAYQHLTQAQSLALPGSATADHARRLLEQLFP